MITEIYPQTTRDKRIKISTYNTDDKYLCPGKFQNWACSGIMIPVGYVEFCKIPRVFLECPNCGLKISLQIGS
jgi:hypothetical protein